MNYKKSKQKEDWTDARRMAREIFESITYNPVFDLKSEYPWPSGPPREIPEAAGESEK